MATRPHELKGAASVGDRPVPITELHVRGFRCFEELHVTGLTRVNLILGRNNSGKTALLEAVEVVLSGSLGGFISGPARRGERTSLEVTEQLRPLRRDSGIVATHLFHGRGLAIGTRFDIDARGVAPRHASAVVEPLNMSTDAPLLRQQRLFSGDADDGLLEELARGRLALMLSSGSNSTQIPLTSNSSLDDRLAFAASDRLASERGTPVRFAGARTLSTTVLVRMLDGLGSRSALERVLEVVRVLEPRTADLRSSAHGELGVALEGEDRLVPLGSLGDGFRYVLSIALHLETVADGVLLIDEIDTGLHYSVLTDLWRLVIEGARRLNVQVFATTHSRDCIAALGAVVEDHPDLAVDVSAQRIDIGYSRTVRYAPDKLATAARRHIEIR